MIAMVGGVAAENVRGGLREGSHRPFVSTPAAGFVDRSACLNARYPKHFKDSCRRRPLGFWAGRRGSARSTARLSVQGRILLADSRVSPVDRLRLLTAPSNVDTRTEQVSKLPSGIIMGPTRTPRSRREPDGCLQGRVRRELADPLVWSIYCDPGLPPPCRKPNNPEPDWRVKGTVRGGQQTTTNPNVESRLGGVPSLP